MKKEEAIEMLKALNMMLRNPNGEPISDVCEAIDMAIEALSEPINCVKCKHYYETEDDTDVHGHCKMDTIDIKHRMTTTEAIKKLQKQKAKYLVEVWEDYSGVAEAYDMAIKALTCAVQGHSCDGCKYVGIIEKCEQCRRIYSEMDDLYKGGAE